MSKREKPPKRTTNLFWLTKSQSHKFDMYLRYLPENEHYRKSLEPLIGAVVRIVCEKWKAVPAKIDGVDCIKILLIDADVIKCPASRNIEVPVHIQHIWTAVDIDCVDRNQFVSSCTLKFKGFLYLYNHKGTKNIGLQTCSVRQVKDGMSM